VPLLRQAAGKPYDEMSVPGTDLGLDLLLTDTPDQGVLFVPYRATGQNADGSPAVQTLNPFFVGIGRTGRSSDAGFSVQLTGVEGAAALLAKQEARPGIVWLAFLASTDGALI